MSGRYVLTVEYDEWNPEYVPPSPEPQYASYQTDPDRRAPNQREPRIGRRVMSIELTADQWKALQRATLEQI